MGPSLLALSITWSGRPVLWLTPGTRMFHLEPRTICPDGGGSGFTKNQEWPYFPYSWTGLYFTINSLSVYLVIPWLQRNLSASWQTTVQSILGVSFLILFDCYCFVLYFWHMVALPSYVTDHRDLMEEMGGPRLCGCPGCIRVECMIRPPKMAILLLSVHPL